MAKFLDATGLTQVMSVIKPGLIKVINSGQTLDVTASTTKTGIYLFKAGSTIQFTNTMSETVEDDDVLGYITISSSTNYVDAYIVAMSNTLIGYNVEKRTDPTSGEVTYSMDGATTLRTSDISTSITSSSDDDEVPSAKAVYDLFNDGMDEIGALIGTVSSS